MLLQNHYPRFRGAPSGHFRMLTKRPPSVDSGLGLPLRANVLKVPHHGSKSSTTPRLLTAVSPVTAVISAGADNSYGHPHPDVTDRLDAALGGDRTYLTAERGDIEFITDGKRLWVRTAR